MTDKNYEEYERACKSIRQENAELLAGFQQWLEQKGLAKNTIEKHANNVKFYLNEYLLYEDAIPAKEGHTHISSFLGYWFIRKAMWASPSAIKENAASLKKFYTFMHEQGHISKDDLQEMKEIIKAKMPDWIKTVRRYDDPDIDDPADIWGF